VVSGGWGLCPCSEPKKDGLIEPGEKAVSGFELGGGKVEQLRRAAWGRGGEAFGGDRQSRMCLVKGALKKESKKWLDFWVRGAKKKKCKKES